MLAQISVIKIQGCIRRANTIGSRRKPREAFQNSDIGMQGYTVMRHEQATGLRFRTNGRLGPRSEHGPCECATDDVWVSSSVRQRFTIVSDSFRLVLVVIRMQS